MSAVLPPKPVGVNQAIVGCTEPLMSFPYTLMSATTLNNTRAASSVRSNAICVRALSSMPTTQIHVMPMMNTMPTTRLHQVLFARLSHPNRRNEYFAAIAARLGMMMRSAIMLLQPPSHPVRGPIARHPGEVRAAIGIGAIEVEERGGDARHRDEREPHDRRRLEPDFGGDEAERGRQAVAGRSGGDADHGRRHETERARLQALALDRAAELRLSNGHVAPSWPPPPAAVHVVR